MYAKSHITMLFLNHGVNDSYYKYLYNLYLNIEALKV
jgi:hypothetical protein